jgi:predicted glycoside hydrolase/deacetylase ChbG (UPF0249 family)
MKYLIVNSDEFGASRGINCGIFEAHHHGILTSASLMVNAPGSEEAAHMSKAMPELSLGLHAALRQDVIRRGTVQDLRNELLGQLTQFENLTGQLPTHLDSVHNAHFHPRALPVFTEIARENGLPLREHSSIRHFARFYGQSRGQTNLERVSVQTLCSILKNSIAFGVTELSCHPGYIDAEFCNAYTIEREAELRSLCDPAVRETILDESIHLISYLELRRFARVPA